MSPHIPSRKNLRDNSEGRMKTALPPQCRYCGKKPLPRDEIGLNKKLFETEAKKKRFMCLHCMADYLDCSEDDLREKIEDFKREGCKLFS